MKNNYLRAGILVAAVLSAATAQAQNVGIGTTTPKSKLSVNGSTASGGLAIGDAGYTSTTGIVAPINGAIIQGNTGIGTLAPICQLDVRGTTKIMSTTGAQTGEFWSGTANVDGFEVIAYPDNVVAVGIQRAGVFPPLHLSKPAGAADGDSFISLIVGGLLRGNVTVSGGGVAYNTTSDERLKENIRPSAKGLDDVMEIQVSDYNYKTSPERAETGFIAQQLNTVFPNAVTVGGEDPTKNPWTVDYGRITPVLVKAVQEQQAEIAALKAENEKLKAQAEKFDALAARMEAMEKSMAASTKGRGEAVRTVALTK